MSFETICVSSSEFCKNYFDIFGLHTWGIDPDYKWLSNICTIRLPPPKYMGSRHDGIMIFYFWVIVLYSDSDFQNFPLAVHIWKITVLAKKPSFCTYFRAENWRYMCRMTAYQKNILIFRFYKNKFTTFIIVYETLRSFIFRECNTKFAKIPQNLIKLSEIWRFLAFDDSTNKPKLFVPYGRNTSFIIPPNGGSFFKVVKNSDISKMH